MSELTVICVRDSGFIPMCPNPKPIVETSIYEMDTDSKQFKKEVNSLTHAILEAFENNDRVTSVVIKRATPADWARCKRIAE